MEYDVNSMTLSNPLPVETVLTKPTLMAYQFVLLSEMVVASGLPAMSSVIFMVT